MRREVQTGAHSETYRVNQQNKTTQSLIRNNTQTAVTNMTIKRILENKIH